MMSPDSKEAGEVKEFHYSVEAIPGRGFVAAEVEDIQDFAEKSAE